MKKAIAVFFTIAALSLPTPPAAAEDLLEIIITGGIRAPTADRDIPAATDVVTRADIEAAPAATVSDLLRGRGGIQITDLRGDGADSGIRLRGFSQTAHANVLVLVDGRRLNYADTRAPDLSHVSTNDIERIEIIHGSAGVLYGDQAVGGVVNVVTRRGAKSARLEVGAGSYNRRAARAFVGDRARGENGDETTWRLTAESFAADGYRDHSARRFNNLNALADYDYGRGNVFVELQSLNDDLELPGALLEHEYRQNRRQSHPAFADDFSDTRVAVGRVGIRHRLNNHWQAHAELTARDTDQRLTQSLRSSPYPVRGGLGRRDAASFNPRFIGRYDTDRGETVWTLGADIERNDYRLFIPYSFRDFATGAPAVAATDQSNAQKTQSLYGQAIFPLRADTAIIAGARRAEVDNDLWDSGVFPTGRRITDSVSVATLGLNHRRDEHTRVYARLDENFRFAKVNEITAAGGVALNTQTGLSTEAGLEIRDAKAAVGLNVYRLDLENEIYYDPTVGDFGANVNLDKTRRRGLSLNINIAQTPNLDLFFATAHTRAQFASGGLKGKTISGVAPHTATLGATYRPARGWQINAQARFAAAQHPIGDNLNATGKTPGYGVVNLGATYKKDDWTFRLAVRNALNKQYAEHITDSGFGRGYQPSPGRAVAAAIGVSLR